RLYTAEQRHVGILRGACDDRRSELIAIGPAEVAAIRPEDLAGFSYVEHAENVALALRVCADPGVDRETALRGMWGATPDPGAMTTHDIRFFDRRLVFVNGFAANDPASTERLWTLSCERFANLGKRIAIFNCRIDRPDRSQQLAAACATWLPADHYVLIGSGTFIFARAATAAGIDARRIVVAEHRSVADIFETVVG